MNLNTINFDAFILLCIFWEMTNMYEFLILTESYVENLEFLATFDASIF